MKKQLGKERADRRLGAVAPFVTSVDGQFHFRSGEKASGISEPHHLPLGVADEQKLGNSRAVH